MKKYKVEFIRKETFCVDVLAENEEQATELAEKKFEEAEKHGTEHYLGTGDGERLVGNVYDVTNTDDPFNA